MGMAHSPWALEAHLFQGFLIAPGPLTTTKHVQHTTSRGVAGGSEDCYCAPAARVHQPGDKDPKSGFASFRRGQKNLRVLTKKSVPSGHQIWQAGKSTI